MKHKLMMRKLSISAPKMTIKRQLPLPFRVLSWLLPMAVFGTLMLGAYEIGRASSNDGSGRSVSTVQRDDTAESKIKIAHSTQDQMSEQIRALESENARLKEELAYFNNLLPTSTGAGGVTIQGLSLDTVAPNQLRYRTLVMQGGNGKQRVSGSLQLTITAQRGGESVTLTFPGDSAADREKFKIGFRHYQRLEGNLTLPEGVTVKHVQARVIDNGHVLAERVVDMSPMKLARLN